MQTFNSFSALQNANTCTFDPSASPRTFVATNNGEVKEADEKVKEIMSALLQSVTRKVDAYLAGKLSQEEAAELEYELNNSIFDTIDGDFQEQRYRISDRKYKSTPADPALPPGW